MARGGKGLPAGFGPTQQGQYGDQAARSRSLAAVPSAASGPAGAPTGPPPGAPPAGFGPSDSPPLDAPTMRPGELVTDGASFGPGRGLGDLSLPRPPQEQDKVDAKIFSQHLPALEAVASEPGSSAALRSFVRRLRAQLPIDFDPTAGAP